MAEQATPPPPLSNLRPQRGPLSTPGPAPPEGASDPRLTAGVSSHRGTTVGSRRAVLAGAGTGAGSGSGGAVVGIVGGSGGVGASTFAAVLASSLDAVLLDLDASAGGIDVLLGAEDVPGVRWSGLHLGGGELSPQLLADSLPRWRSVPFVAADSSPSAGSVRQLLGIATQLGPCVIDLGRSEGDARTAAAAVCDLVVVLARSDVSGVTGARATACALADRPGGVVVRARRRAAGGTPRPHRIAALVGLPLLGTLPVSGRPGESPLATGTLPRSLRAVAGGVLDALGRRAA